MGRRDGENPAPAVIGTAKESGIRTRAYPETLSGQLTVRLQGVWLPGLHRWALPAEHRGDHRPDSTDVLRRLLPHGDKKSGRAAARCGGKPVHRNR
jgi:hypothetical protein